MEAIINRFLSIGYGYGDGSGDGDGYGSGSGYGSGDGVSKYNGQNVYLVDGVSTIINSVRGNYAKGFILSGDLTLKPCYVAKVGDYFAHGETLKGALRDAQQKYNSNLSEEERIDMFVNEFKQGEKYPAKKFFDWHNILTGSCELGRKEFCRERDIDLNTDSFTIAEFIDLTKSSYGSEMIKQVEKRYSNN